MSVKLENPNITNDPKEVIKEAADLIEKHPKIWGKGMWIVAEDDHGHTREFDDGSYIAENVDACTIGGVCQVCLEGALLLFAANYRTYERAKDIVEEHVQTAPLEFNDREDTTQGDVVQVLRDSLKEVK